MHQQMKKLLLLAVIVIGVWWYRSAGHKLTEDDVNNFYRDYQVATLQRKPGDLCALLADDFQSSAVMAAGREVRADAQDKEQTCAAWRDLYDSWDKLGEKMGGMLQLDSHYTIHHIAISSDRKSATVDVSSSLDVAGSLMNMRSRSTDTLVRRNGKVMLQRSEGRVSVDGGT